MTRIFKNLKKLESQQEKLCELRQELVEEADGYLKDLEAKSEGFDEEVAKNSDLISDGIQQLEQRRKK